MPASVARKRFPVAGSRPMELPPVMVCMPDLPETSTVGPALLDPEAARKKQLAETPPGSKRAPEKTAPEDAASHRPRNRERRPPRIALWNHWSTKTAVGAALLLLLLLVFVVFGRNNPGEPVVDADAPAAAEGDSGPTTSASTPEQPTGDDGFQLDFPPPRPAMDGPQTPSSRISAGGASQAGSAAAPIISDSAATAGKPDVRPRGPGKVGGTPADNSAGDTKRKRRKPSEHGPALTGPETPIADARPDMEKQERPFPAPPTLAGADQPSGNPGLSETEISPPAEATSFGTAPGPADTRAKFDTGVTAGTDGPLTPEHTVASSPNETGFDRPPFAEVPPLQEQRHPYPTTGLENPTSTWQRQPVDDLRGGAQDVGGRPYGMRPPATSPYPTTNTPEAYGLSDRRFDSPGQGGTPAIEALGRPRDSRFGGASAPAAPPQYPTTNTPSLDYLRSRVAGDQPAYRTSMRPSPSPPSPSAETAPSGATPRVGEAQLRGFIEPPPMRPRYE